MRKLRHTIQLSFLAGTLLLVHGLRFNAEAYCPFGAVETFYTFLNEGKMLCVLGIGNIFALISVVVLTLIFRRVFCGYACPIGAVSEFLRVLAKKFGFRQKELPRKYDRVLSSLKYLVLLLVLVMTGATVNLFYRFINPCQFFVAIEEKIQLSAYIAAAVFVILSFIISMPFCRWYCPFAAVQNIFSYFGLTRIARDTQKCADCGKCSKSCPMNIDVAKSTQVRSPDCISCFECIDSCPAKDQNNSKPLSWLMPGNKKISSLKTVIVTAVLVSVMSTAAMSTLIDFPTFIYNRRIAKTDNTGNIKLEIEGIRCSGSAKLFTYFLDRKDISEVKGYLKVATRPRTGWVDVSIDYDPSMTGKERIIEAVLEPYYDQSEQRWSPSPFQVKGFDLLDIWDQ